MTAAELADRIGQRYSDVVVARGEATLIVEASDLIAALSFLRDEPDLGFDSLSGMTATDWPEQTPRFWVVYDLYSAQHRHRLRVKAGLLGDDPRIASVTPMFPTANWHEREAFDFYGVTFDGHPNLQRILMPDDWEGHPLRKSEELGGVNTRYRGAFIPPVDRRER
jgi:NADH-quinone oxidoreductase subunit C